MCQGECVSACVCVLGRVYDVWCGIRKPQNRKRQGQNLLPITEPGENRACADPVR